MIEYICARLTIFKQGGIYMSFEISEYEGYEVKIKNKKAVKEQIEEKEKTENGENSEKED